MDTGAWWLYRPQGHKELDTMEATQHTHNLLSTGSLKLRGAVFISEQLSGALESLPAELCSGKEQMCPGNTSWSYYQLSTVYFALWSLLSILEFSSRLLTYIKVCVIQFFQRSSLKRMNFKYHEAFQYIQKKENCSYGSL